jgi:hypothetical protein
MEDEHNNKERGGSTQLKNSQIHPKTLFKEVSIE